MDDMGDPPPRPDGDVLARRLADARRRLAELDLPATVAVRLHRQFIAICDAVKVPDADQAAGLRRLMAFLATLEQAAARGLGNKGQRDRPRP
jgi:hypothetical protein